MNTIKYRKDIDGLRAVAVCAVIFFHAFPKKFNGGFLGVDIFFVISGYLITSIILLDFNNNKFSILEFYRKRIKRIFPALICVFLAILIFGFYFLLPDDYISLGKHIYSGAAFFSNYTLYKEINYFDKSSELKPLLHLWSLSIEEQFYIIWPLLMYLFVYKFKRSNKIILLLMIFSLIINIYWTYTNKMLAFYSPISRFVELSIGGSIAINFSFLKNKIYQIKEKIRNKYNFIINLTFTLLLLSLVFIKNDENFPGITILFPTLLTALLILDEDNQSLAKKILSHKITVFIGLISYPLYLWHWPIFSFAKLLNFMFLGWKNWQIKFLLIILCLLLATTTYFFIEKPLRKKNHSPYLPLWLVLIMICLSTFGIKISNSDGFISRFPPTIQQIITPINFNFFEEARFGICHYDNNVKTIATVGNKTCVEKNSTQILIWGDSYAAALYPGLRELQKKYKFSIIQSTSCGTPPILNINFDNGCANSQQMNKWNQQTLKLIEKEKPANVLLHAWWNNYGNAEFQIKEISLTIDKIHHISPNSKIIILGNVPQWGGWEDGLQRTMYRFWKIFRQLPSTYLKYGLSNLVYDDPRVISAITSKGAKYISAYNELCNEQGCITRLGDKPEDITSIDNGHLSKKGSIFLMDKIYNQIFDI